MTYILLTLENDLTPIGDKDLYDQDKLEYKNNYNRLNNLIKSNNLITISQVSDALRYAKTDLLTVNPEQLDTPPLPNFQPRPQNHQRQIAVIDNHFVPQLQVTVDGFTGFSDNQQNYH